MSRYFTPAPPRILAHRGLALGVPENTPGAFAAALAAGAGYLESDVRATADGQAVLWHDADLRRFDGSRLQLRRLGLATLQARHMQGERIATLAEALAAFPQARFNLDLKDARAVVPAARAIRAAGAEHRVLLTSFAERRARAVWRLVPEAARSAGAERLLLAVTAVRLGDERLLARALHGIDALQIPPRAAGLDLLQPARLAAFRRHVREIHVWTVNDPLEIGSLIDAGIEGIVTDRADVAVRVLGERGYDIGSSPS